MRDLLIGFVIIGLAIWWAVDNPQTANKIVTELKSAATKIVNTVSD